MARFSFRAAASALLVTGLLFGSLDASATESSNVTINSSEARQKGVAYDDLNLSTQRGVESLYRRISNAAEQVCGVAAGRMPIGLAASAKACKKQSIARAVEQVNLPQLNAHHQAMVERGARS
jgi:UrcA family protein